MIPRGAETALLCDSSLRRPLRQALSRALPDLAVVAYPEVPNDLLLEPVAMIKPDDLVVPIADPNGVVPASESTKPNWSTGPQPAFAAAAA